MKGWVKLLAGWCLGLATVGAGALIVVETGIFDTRASTPHAAPVYWATHTVMIRSTRLRAHAITAPKQFTAAQVAAGFALYDANCTSCHGAPGVSRGRWAEGLTPTPPYLLDSAKRWSPAELYLIVGDGVKMTAMPSWRASRSPAEVWSLVAFLRVMPRLSPAAYLRLREAAADSQAQDPVVAFTRAKATSP